MDDHKICPYCGTHVESGEHCNCPDARRAWAAHLIAPLTVGEKVQLLEFLTVLSTDTGKEAVA